MLTGTLDLMLTLLFALLGTIALFTGETQTGIMWLMLSELWAIAIVLGFINRKLGT